MFENGLREEYFCWLADKALGEQKEEYHYLLYALFTTEYTFSIPDDENRLKDGIGLRYQFGWDNRYSTQVVQDQIDICPCSVLEMMLALCRRMEREYMYSPLAGDRTATWFYQMLGSMSLIDYTDNDWYDGIESLVQHKLNVMMNRQYLPNGEGGLFICNKNNIDMRRLSYWNQMIRRVNDLYGY